MEIIEIERYDVLKRLLKCGAYTFKKNKEKMTMLSALNKVGKYDVILYLCKILPYFHVEHLMRLMRLENNKPISVSESVD